MKLLTINIFILSLLYFCLAAGGAPTLGKDRRALPSPLQYKEQKGHDSSTGHGFFFSSTIHSSEFTLQANALTANEARAKSSFPTISNSTLPVWCVLLGSIPALAFLVALALYSFYSRGQVNHLKNHLHELVAERTEELLSRNQQLLTKIQQHKQNEHALREGEKRYRDLLENVSDVVWRIDMEGRFTYISPSVSNMIGGLPEDYLGGSFDRFLPPSEIPKAVESLEKRKKGELGLAEHVFELTILRRDGTRFISENRTKPILNAKEELIEISGITFDITDRKKLEDQLLQSQKMEAIGKLAGGIAHDFNNLLTAILGYSNILVKKIPSTEPYYKHIQEIKNAGERAASLTNQLLSFSRKQIQEPQILDLNDIILNMDKMLRRLIGEDIEFITIPDSQLKRIKADPTQLEQIIMNLVVNARDAMPQGGKLIIETRNHEQNAPLQSNWLQLNPGSYVCLSIHDSGFGIPEEIQQKIFEPFFTTKEVGKGTGLGLSTVYGIVRQSNGGIHLQSEINHGSTFIVYLPAVDKEEPTNLTPLISTDNLMGNETILLVEDEEIVRSLITDVLRDHGYNVLEASYPGQAIKICKQYDKTIHLLISDIVLPHQSGIELAKILETMRGDMHVLLI
ncbi:PAS domain S-box protein, partial [bacterium]|nr:PAS domain S-box protein [bacterium]